MGQLSGCPFCLQNIPSLNKSTYGFCGHKCRMALRGSSAGASLPSSPRFPLQHFCRAKTPQDFSARENQMMARKRTPAYWRMPRTMTQSALICTWGPRKVERPCGERRTHHSGEGCPSGSARLKRRLRLTKKRVCPCQAKVRFSNALPVFLFHRRLDMSKPADRNQRA